jgi:hypothetical protein
MGWTTGVQFPVGAVMGFFSSPQSPDRLWAPPSLLSDGYRMLLPRGESGRGVKLTTRLYIVPTLRMRGAIPPFPNTSSWHGALLSTRTILPLPFYVH